MACCNASCLTKREKVPPLAEEVPEYTPKKRVPPPTRDPYDSTTSRIRTVDTVTIMWNHWREPIFSGGWWGTRRQKGQIGVGVFSTTEALHAKKKDSSHSWHTTECDECKTIGGCLLHLREHFDTVVSACTSTAGHCRDAPLGTGRRPPEAERPERGAAPSDRERPAAHCFESGVPSVQH